MMAQSMEWGSHPGVSFDIKLIEKLFGTNEETFCLFPVEEGRNDKVSVKGTVQLEFFRENSHSPVAIELIMER